MSSACERCGVELTRPGMATDRGPWEGSDYKVEHTPERCSSRRIAKLEERLREAEREPRMRPVGCGHTVARMREWIHEGACPICLTATCAMMREAAKEQQVVLEENAQAADRLANEVRELRGLNNQHVAKLEALEAKLKALKDAVRGLHALKPYWGKLTVPQDVNALFDALAAPEDPDA